MFHFVILPLWVLECVACLTGLIFLIRSQVQQGKHWITYSKYTAGFFTSIKLTCQLDPKDADVILMQHTSARTITFNPANNLITATHAAD